MLTLLSQNTADLPLLESAIRIAPLVGLGVVSAALLAKALPSLLPSQTTNIPTVPLPHGASSHDAVYNEDQDKFLETNREKYGDVYRIQLLGQTLVVVSGPVLREVFLSKDMSFSDAMNEITGMDAVLHSMIKSNKDKDNVVIREIVRDTVSPNMPLFMPKIVVQFEKGLTKDIGICKDKLIKNPMVVIQEMIASSMANVFLGPDVACHPAVVKTFMNSTNDFGQVLGGGERLSKNALRTFITRRKHQYMAPMGQHIKVLIDAATPAILERRRQEAEQGEAYQRPPDMLQRFLDKFDTYGFADLEDIMGHILVIVLASVHTTTDTSTTSLYYLATHPEAAEVLYNEITTVLAEEAAEKARREKEEGVKPSDEPQGPEEMWTARAMKKMVHLDSFVREQLRYRSDKLTLMHQARQDVLLSNGSLIHKGEVVVCDYYSSHYSAEYQGPSAREFKPFRFVPPQNDQKTDGPLMANKLATKVGQDFLAFGMGPHACPGRFLAVQEIKTIIAMVVLNYKSVKLEEDTEEMVEKCMKLNFGHPVATGLYFTSRDNQ